MDEKIADFFSFWKLLADVKDVSFNKTDFLSDTDDNDDLDDHY